MLTPHAAPSTTALALEAKFTALDLKAIADDGAFEGYASLFNREDLGHDIVLPGAFRDSLARARRRRHQAAVPARPDRADRRLGARSPRTPAASTPAAA